MKTASKINLLIWVNSNNIGGVESWVLTLKKNLKNSKYKVILLSDGKRVAREEKADIVVSSWNQLEDLIKEFSPALVVPNYRYPIFGICAKLRKSGYKLKTLGICHADSEKEYYEPLTWYESAIDAFIAVSPTCKEKLCDYLPQRKDDIYYVSYGIEIKNDFQKTYNIQHLKLIYFGRIEQEQKRVFDFVKLIKILESSQVAYSFDIIGSGAKQNKLKKSLANIRCQDRVKLINELPHASILKKLKDYDVFVQVSEYEGQSISMLEAMVAKLIPCVTKDVSGSWKLINHGQNGFCLNIGDMKAMARVIKNLSLMDKTEIENMGENAYHTVREKYDIKRIIARYTEVFDVCMRNPDKRWAHDKTYIMPNGYSSHYFPQNKLLGIILKIILKIIPRMKIRTLLSK